MPVVSRKSWVERAAPVLLILVVVMAFGLGAMWSRLKSLESKTGVSGNTVGRYKNFDEALADYAKLARMDVKKFQSCVSGGGKKQLVDADLAEGSKLGVAGTPGFFVNGIFVGGAFPFETFKEIIDFELKGGAPAEVKKYSQILQNAADQGAFNPVKKDVPMGNAPIRGEGSITVIEYSDFQCPFCARSYPTMGQVLKDYAGKVKLVYKHFPLNSIHPKAQKAAEASECAKDQGKFWEFHDKLFENQTEWASL